MAPDTIDIPASYITMRYLKCECNELFFTEESIQEHFITTSHRDIISDLRTFQCNICTKCTETEQAMLAHHNMMHKNPRQNDIVSRFPRASKGSGLTTKDCRYCGKGFKNSSSRYAHEKIHSGVKPFKCKYCDRAFINKTNLMIHHYSHTGERPYSCNLCIMAFRSLSNLNRHKQGHAGIKPYSCPVCARVFASKYEVKQHNEVIHLKMPYPYKRKPRGQGRERMTPNLMMKKKMMESEE